MSLSHHKCKAFVSWIEQALWVLMGIVIFGLWCFAIWKAVTCL